LTETDDLVSIGSVQVGAARAFIGLAQGLALYGYFEAFQNAAWPATNGPLFAALCVTAIFVPLIVVLDLTELRPRLLAGWVLVATLICACVAWYDIYRDPTSAQALPRNLPSPQLWFGLGLGLFVGHSLLISGANDKRFIARYSTYFGVAWKYGLQAAVAAAFAGVFWLVLLLGAALFKLIELDFLSRLVEKPWFWIPATTIVLTCAIHLSDIRVGIIRGIRTLSCNLLAWLLPLMALIAVGFIAALPYTGLQPLWNTRHASPILLAAAASLIFLVNAAYQDGARAGDGSAGDARPMPPLLRWAIAAASIVLVPIVLLTAYGISLRVRQYGWTPERVVATACTLLAALYAVGYAIGGIRSNISPFWLEATNIATAFASTLIFLALFTPLADPARISVDDQVGRLKAGAIAPEKFDYPFLRFSSGRFGIDALRELAERKDLPLVAERSADALQKKFRDPFARGPLAAEDRARNIMVVRPQGQTLPPSFLETNWGKLRISPSAPLCLTEPSNCEAVIADLNGDGIAEIVILSPGYGPAAVFSSSDGQVWSYIGSLPKCTGVFDALLAGNYKLVEPEWRDLEVAGRRLRLVTSSDCSSNGLKR
jgi:hypothetical protein